MILSIQIVKLWIQLLNLSTNLPMYPKLAFLKSQALITAFITVAVKRLQPLIKKSTFQIPL